MPSTSEQSALLSARMTYLERLGDTFSNLSARFLIEKADMKSDEYILDVATGPGTVIFESLCQYDNPPFFAGVDMSTGMLYGANQMLAHLFSMPNIKADFEQGDAHHLPYGEDVFDQVLSNLGIHLFQDKKQAIAEMYRVLKPGGRLGLTIPYLIPESFRVEGILDLLSPELRATVQEFERFAGLKYTIVDELVEKLGLSGFCEPHTDETKVPYPCVGALEAFGLIKTVLYYSGKVPSAQYTDMFSGLDFISATPSVYSDMNHQAVLLGVARIWCTKPGE